MGDFPKLDPKSPKIGVLLRCYHFNKHCVSDFRICDEVTLLSGNIPPEALSFGVYISQLSKLCHLCSEYVRHHLTK